MSLRIQSLKMYLGAMLALLLVGTEVVLCVTKKNPKKSRTVDLDACRNRLAKNCKHKSVGIGKSVNSFGDKLYGELAKDPGNIVFSPFSVHAGLSLLTLGTSGKTQKQLLSKLSFSNLGDLKKHYSAYIAKFRNLSNENFLIANTAFLDKRFSVLKSFKKDAKHIFEANAQNVEFNQPARAAAIINKWVANQTHNLILEIINKESLDPMTALILLNAIYFNGKWETAFDKSQTLKGEAFYTPSGEVKCDLMFMSYHKFRYLNNNSFRILEMPFRSVNIKIAFVQPMYGYGETMENVEKVLSAETFFSKIRGLKPRIINIEIPKFKISKTYPLKDQLKSLGISDIFKFETANFSKLFAEKLPAYVSDVDHEAVVDISEKGAMAAAATAVKMVVKTGPPTFALDTPFLFFLYDKISEVILMRGRVENPALR